MVKRIYIPERGDLVWVNFNSSDGHEQKGLRPALVLSPILYNEKSGLCLICPVTSKEKGYPFEVCLSSQSVGGVVLVDQIRSLDWQARDFKFVEKADNFVLQSVLAKIKTLLV